MGFLLFAFRKLSLKRRINQKNFQMTLLSNQRQQIESQMSVMEQAKAASEDAWSMMSNSMTTTTNTIFQSQMSANNQEAIKSITDYSTLKQAMTNYDANKGDTAKQNEILNNAGVTDAKALQDAIDAANTTMTKSQLQAQEKNQAAQAAMQASQLAIVTANQCVNSVFSAMDQGKMNTLQRQDQRIEIEISGLESEVKILQAEYENVEKAENQEAKDTAPNFGLA